MTATELGPLLALDSSTRLGSAAVGGTGGLMVEITAGMARGHSIGLLPAAAQALELAGLAPADLQGVAVAGGPGSFTGLRIAAATAKGLCRALRIPLFSYSGLAAAAVSAWAADGPVCAVFDARGQDLYAACYRFDEEPEVLLGPAAVPVEQLVERLSGMRVAAVTGEVGHAKVRELARALGATLAPLNLGMPRASALLHLATRYPESGRVADPARWEPDYVRASGAERIAAEGRRPASRS